VQCNDIWIVENTYTFVIYKSNLSYNKFIFSIIYVIYAYIHILLHSAYIINKYTCPDLLTTNECQSGLPNIIY
jgi:hypothetical protein